MIADPENVHGNPLIEIQIYSKNVKFLKNLQYNLDFNQYHVHFFGLQSSWSYTM